MTRITTRSGARSWTPRVSAPRKPPPRGRAICADRPRLRNDASWPLAPPGSLYRSAGNSSSTLPGSPWHPPDQVVESAASGMKTPDRNSKPAKVKTVLVLDGDVLVPRSRTLFTAQHVSCRTRPNDLLTDMRRPASSSNATSYANSPLPGSLPALLWRLVRLLLRRMAVLDVAPDQVNSADPLLFRELQGRCSLCPSRATWACDLAQDAANAQSRNWREYCPDAAMLGFLSRTARANILLSAQVR